MFDILLTSSSDISSWKVVEEDDDDDDDDGEEMLGKKFLEQTKAGGDIILHSNNVTKRLLECRSPDVEDCVTWLVIASGPMRFKNIVSMVQENLKRGGKVEIAATYR